MTEKQIIIDSIPVQDCCYFDYENDGYEDSCYIHQNECSAQNCYYKQLKRKEQENKKLKNILKDIDKKLELALDTEQTDTEESFNLLYEIQDILTEVMEEE